MYTSAGNREVPIPVHDDRVLENKGRQTSETEVEDGTAGFQLLGGIFDFIFDGHSEVAGSFLERFNDDGGQRLLYLWRQR
jgi:hypothetical protein